jgi:hypothetical protein
LQAAKTNVYHEQELEFKAGRVAWIPGPNKALFSIETNFDADRIRGLS